MSEQVVETIAIAETPTAVETAVVAEPAAETAVVAEPTAPVADKPKVARAKFADENPKAANKWGIKNEAGKVVTAAYLKAYMQCWTRQELGYVGTATHTRKQIYEICMSDAWITAQLAKEPNATASRIGQLCSFDDMWGPVAAKAREGNAPKRTAKPAAAPTAVVTPVVTPEPVDPAAAAFEAAAPKNTDVVEVSADAKSAARDAANAKARGNRK